MARPPMDECGSELISVRLPAPLRWHLTDYCASSGASLSAVVRRALELLLNAGTPIKKTAPEEKEVCL